MQKWSKEKAVVRPLGGPVEAAALVEEKGKVSPLKDLKGREEEEWGRRAEACDGITQA